jgi:hypothetical protein
MWQRRSHIYAPKALLTRFDGTDVGQTLRRRKLWRERIGELVLPSVAKPIINSRNKRRSAR